MRKTTMAILCCLGAIRTAAAAERPNMLGRQSQNEGLPVVPAPGKVRVDGDLGDWDLSGRIWAFADRGVRDRYSVKAAAMWDQRHLYLAARWKDPTPMFSRIDPAFNPNDGWKSDSWQLRVRTDRTLWITTWYFTPKKMPVMHVDYWKDPKNSRGEHEIVLLRAEPGGTDLGRGVEMAYRKDDDGRGFVQEIKLPWTLIFAEPPDVKAGMVFQLGMEFLWGDVTGKTWPIHRYADNMQPGATSREFFWSNWKAWGDATLSAKGNVPMRRYVAAGELLKGTVPIRATIPAGAERFALVIEDESGRRVRNLAGDFEPSAYTVGTEGERRTVEVKWDCLDDWGKLVRPGEYRVRGLTRGGLRASYEMTFYNPGTPPWRTKDGSGAWGADHAAPIRVVAAGEWMIVSWPFAEGGSGIVGIAPDGRKRWGEKRGASVLAADGEFVYAMPASWHVKTPCVSRFAARDGSYKPFVLAGKPRPFDLPLEAIFAGKVPGEVTDMAAGGGKLVLALSAGKLAVLDAASAKLLKIHDADSPTAVAFAGEGALYAVLDGRVHRVEIASGRKTAVAAPGLGKAGAIAVDRDGNVVIADVGADSRVKAYSPSGKLAYTCGRKGGRPIRGRFDPQAMTHVSSVAVDHRGRVWAVEHWQYPRRVSVWGRDGRLVSDYVGNTGYAGTGCFLHDQSPALGYVGPIEIELDKAKRAWRVSRVLWVPDEDKGECFALSPSSHKQAQRLTSSASGTAREYLYKHDREQVVYMRRGRGWQPVAAVCLVGHISGRINRHNVIEEDPSGEFAGLNAHDGVFWNDRNKDGRVQRGECDILATTKPGKAGDTSWKSRGEPGLPLGNGWGGRIDENLTFWADGIVRYRPIGFADDGAPMYGRAGMKPLGIDERGDLVGVPAEHLLLCLSFKGYAGRTTGMLGLDDRTGAVRWSYPNPYPGVHGSHRAPMPKPGLLIGPLKICGVAKVDDRVGRVFCLRGNLGQDYFLTTDGLFVGAMFQDGRLPAESLPADEQTLTRMAMEGFSHGSEPFNGWFGRQSDGTIRMTTGFAREAAMVLRVHGLETIRRFDAPTVRIDRATIVKANRQNVARAAAPAKEKTCTVARLAKAPKIDGRGERLWQKAPPIRIEREGSPHRARARVAYDGENLYLLVEVTDASPWRNEGKDATRLFKTGDAVDLQLNTDPAAKAKRSKLLASDVRVVFAKLAGKAAAVLMKPVDPGAPPERRVKYHSPVGERLFDRVEVLSAAAVAVTVGEGKYALEAAVPLKAIGLAPKAGTAVRGDVGIISSDAAGRTNVARTYWANPHTNIVSDLPIEAWLYPSRWGELAFK